VRRSEIDSQSHVYNGRYLDYADIAVTEYLRNLGFLFGPGADTPEFHVVKATIEYKSPIVVDEEIDLSVRTVRIGHTSWTVLIEFSGRVNGDLRATAEMIFVTISSGKKLAVPQAIRAAFDGSEGAAS
jgi:acyl-CoA thioester hydrolase